VTCRKQIQDGEQIEQPISCDTKIIIQQAVESALCFGTGICTAVKEALEDENIEYTDSIEKYVFDMYENLMN
jgi:hypothetical protein